MTNYTPEDLVDHEGIAAIILNENGEVLIQKHVKYGFWTLPVGKIKKGQSVIDGLKEELYDECGIIPTDYKQIMHKKYRYMRLKKKIIVNCYLFDIKNYTGTLINKEPHKHTTQTFMTIDAIKKLSYLSDLTLLYLDYKGFKRKARI
ncbi:MAG: NUDIX domain-containing protein [Candidatus Woesearchaeota archaeon]|jgi:8-oxo-dGTP pyrophosphatase MutT (NUDIX family)